MIKNKHPKVQKTIQNYTKHNPFEQVGSWWSIFF